MSSPIWTNFPLKSDSSEQERYHSLRNREYLGEKVVNEKEYLSAIADIKEGFSANQRTSSGDMIQSIYCLSRSFEH